jgi:two-component system, OmpR family, response regulator
MQAHRTPGGHRRIPRAEVERFARERGIDLRLPAPEAPPPDARSAVVLDGEPDFAELLRDALELQGGFEVRVCLGLFEAGFHVGRSHPQVVVVDLDLPGLDAGELCRVLRGGGARGRLVGHTAFPSGHGEAQRLASLGFDAVVEKPVSLERLLATILAD